MALTAYDLQKHADDTTDAGVDLIMDSIASLSGEAGVTKLLLGAAGSNGGVVASGNALPVDIDSALPAGTNAIGKLAANSGVTIGDVNVVGDALTALQLADDVVATLGTTTYTETTTKGAVVGAVRNDTLAALANTDNEVAPLQVNASGALYIQEGSALDVSAATLTVNAHAVTNAGVFVVQEDGAALTSLQLIDDIVATLGTSTYTETTTKGAVIGAVRNDSLATLASLDNEIAPLQVNASGALYIQEGAALDVSGATVTVAAHDVTNAGTFVTQLDGDALTALQLLDDIVATLGTTTYTETTTKGAVIGAVRNDSLAALANLDNEVAPLQVDANGALYVNVAAGGGTGGTSETDDGAFTAGSGSGTPAMGFFSTDTVDANDVGVLAMDASRRLLVSIEVDNVGIGGGTQYTDDTSTHSTGSSVGNLLMAAATPTDGSVDVNDIGAVAMSVDRRLHVDAQLVGQDADITIADGGNVISTDWNGTAPPIGAGTEAAALRVTVATDSTGVLTVDNAGTFAVQVDGDALTSLQLIDDVIATLGTTTYSEATTKGAIMGAVRNDTLAALANTDNEIAPLQVNATGALYTAVDGTVTVQEAAAMDVSAATVTVKGSVAHDAADADAPFKIGGKAIAHSSNPTAVAADDITNLYANRHGILWTINGHPNAITKEFTILDSDGAQTNAALITVAGGTKIVVTQCAAICDNANTVDVQVRVGFGAATIPVAATSGATGVVLSHPGIAAGSGYNRGDGSAVLGIGADGEDLRLTCEDPVTGSVIIMVTYFTIES